MAKQTKQMYVAYLDILGFKDMLREANFEDKVEDIVHALEDRRKYDNKYYPHLKYVAISDTIIILADKGHALDLSWKIAQLQNTLLKLGFCLRGGIAYGNVILYVEDGTVQNIFGNTLVQAYSLESEQAIYPRVAISDSIVTQFKNEILAEDAREAKMYVLRDADGVYYVNQFIRDLLNKESSKVTSQKKAVANRKAYLDCIEDAIEEADAKARMKWNWLRGQLRKNLSVS